MLLQLFVAITLERYITVKWNEMRKILFFKVKIIYQISLQLYPSFCNGVGRDSSVGIATRYGLDDPGIESRWGRDFPHPSRPVLGPTQPPVQWVPGLSRG